MSIFAKLDSKVIAKVITSLYIKAFSDPIIGHLFLKSDLADIVRKQTDFVIAMLGGPKNYNGDSLAKAHNKLNIRAAHFNRRQILLKESLMEFNIDKNVTAEWLALEQKFFSQIVKD